jgi:uncharacterized SAM-binding protein YcdF (DUF218 family)
MTMGFILGKIVQSLLLPPASILLLMLAGLFVIRRRRTAGQVLVGIGMVLLYLLSLPAVADMLLRPLESAYPPFAGKGVKADAVVVLTGGVRDLSWIPAPPAPAEESLDRLVVGIQIAASHRLPLVISGGTGAIAPTSVREADVMADTAVRLGFPSRDIVIENSSRNTLESAEAVAAMMPEKTIILVTSAYHLRRSVAMFRKQGFSVIAAPAGYNLRSRAASLSDLIPRAGNLDASSTALSEYTSLAWYTLTGAI